MICPYCGHKNPWLDDPARPLSERSDRALLDIHVAVTHWGWRIPQPTPPNPPNNEVNQT